MEYRIRRLALLFLLAAVGCSEEEQVPANPHLDDPDHEYEIVRLETDFGDMRIWLSYQTPGHRENFLELVERDFYDSLIFHRVIDDFVIQGGDPLGSGTGGPGYTIKAEIDTRLRHEFGAIAAARLSDQLNPDRRSSGSQFYIVEGREGAFGLDGQYTVYGQLVSGYEVLEAIGSVETNGPPNDRPLETVYMLDMVLEYHTRQGLVDQYGFDLADY